MNNKRRNASQTNDDNIFRAGIKFILKRYEDHWHAVQEDTFDTFSAAMEEIEKHDKQRCLVYAVTEAGRFAVAGHSDFDRIRTMLREEQHALEARS